MNVREARVQDFDEWSAMRTALWPETDDGHAKEIAAYFAGTSTDVEMVYLVESGGTVAGFVELAIREPVGDARKLPYVEGWYVRDAYRGCGYGSALMHRAERWARELGYPALASDTDIDNRQSIAMHKHLGFVETERIVCFLKTWEDASRSGPGELAVRASKRYE